MDQMVKKVVSSKYYKEKHVYRPDQTAFERLFFSMVLKQYNLINPWTSYHNVAYQVFGQIDFQFGGYGTVTVNT